MMMLFNAVLQGPYLSGEGTRGTAQGQLGINMFAQAVPNAEPGKAEEVVVCFGVIDILQVGRWVGFQGWARFF